MFKENQLIIKKETKILADSGYQGIQYIHSNSETPTKKKKNQKLSKDDKKGNHELSKKRIFVENVIRKLKVFRILSSRYRNRRKKFGLRVNLISGIYNYELEG